MDRGAWQANVCGVAKSQTRLKQLSTHAFKKKKKEKERLAELGEKEGSFLFSKPLRS